MAPLVGIIILFGFLVVALAGYQAQIVPQQNSEVEFNHNQDVQSDLADLRASLLDVRSADGGRAVREHRPVRVRLGTQYPVRVVAINPSPPSGQLSTRNLGNVSIENAAVNGTYTDEAETILERDHETRLLVFEPDYSEYRNAPTTVFEHSLLYNQFSDATLPVTDQRLVRGGTRSLNVVVFEGDVSESGQRTSLDPETLDGPSAELPLVPESGTEFSIVLPTRLPEVWTSDEMIGETFEEGERNARASVTGDDEVTVTINDSDEGNDWTLEITKVGYDGGEGENTYSNARPLSDTDDGNDTDGSEPVSGPVVDIEDEEVEITTEDAIELGGVTGEVTSVGSDGTLRSGTPIRTIDYTVTGPAGTQALEGVYADLDPDEFNQRTLALSDVPDEYTMDHPITPSEGSEWTEGNYTVTVSARDASGRGTAPGETDAFDVNVSTVDEDPDKPPADDIYDIRHEDWFDDQEYLFEIVSDDVWSVEWDFGDGNTGTSHYQRHTYAAPGTYQITIEVVHEGDEYTYTDTLAVE